MQMAMDVKYALKNLPVFSTVTEYKGMSGANYLSVSSPRAPGATGWGRKEGKLLFSPVELALLRQLSSVELYFCRSCYLLQAVIRLLRIRETCEKFRFLQLSNARSAEPPHHFFA